MTYFLRIYTTEMSKPMLYKALIQLTKNTDCLFDMFAVDVNWPYEQNTEQRFREERVLA